MQVNADWEGLVSHIFLNVDVCKTLPRSTWKYASQKKMKVVFVIHRIWCSVIYSIILLILEGEQGVPTFLNHIEYDFVSCESVFVNSSKLFFVFGLNFQRKIWFSLMHANTHFFFLYCLFKTFECFLSIEWLLLAQ